MHRDASTGKGPETVKAVVDWAGNPHNGPELASAYAKKNWVAGTVGAATDVTIEIWIDGVKVATNKDGELAEGKSAAWTVDPDDNGDRSCSTPLMSKSTCIDALRQRPARLRGRLPARGHRRMAGWQPGRVQHVHPVRVPCRPRHRRLRPDHRPVYYDMNGTRSGLRRAAPGSPIRTRTSSGAGGTEAFFFNQWLGSEKGVGRRVSPVSKAGTPRVSGMGFAGYYGDIDHVGYTYTWPRLPVAGRSMRTTSTASTACSSSPHALAPD